MCSHFTQNCILLYFLEDKNPYFVTKNCWKFSHICVFILSKKRRNWFHKNPHNSGTVGRRKLPDPSLNRVFNALSIGVQYMLSFQWTNFGLKCLIEYNTRNIFVEKAYTKYVSETIPGPLSKISRLSISLDQCGKVLSSLFLLYANLRLSKYSEIKLRTTCFYLV